MPRYVKRFRFTCSEEAARFMRDSLRDTADFIEDQVGDDPDTPRVVAEIRALAKEIESSMLAPATPTEYEEVFDIKGGS